MRQLRTVDVSSDEVKKAMANANNEKTKGVSGAHEVTVVRASLEESASGAIFLKLGFKSPTGSTWTSPSQLIEKLAADGEPVDGYWMPKLMTLLALTGSSMDMGSAEIEEWKWDDNEGKSVLKKFQVPSLITLIGKKVGTVLNFYQKYPNSLGINGYTGRPIPKRNENEDGYNNAKNQPETIWMPNYEKKPQPVFDFTMFYDIATGKNVKEMQDDTCITPTEVKQKVEDILAKGHSAVKLIGDDWDKLRKTTLKKALKKAGATFEAMKFIPSANAGSKSAETGGDASYL